MKQENNFSNESFEELFKATTSNEKQSSNIVSGTIVDISSGFIIVDVGMKSEGRIAINEFKNAEGELPELQIGQQVEVYIVTFENHEGSIVLSREKAKREEIWKELEKIYEEEAPVEGIITKKVKGGLSAIVKDTIAFLPTSQIDIRIVKNFNSLIGTKQQLQILKMDKKRYNIIVSRKAILSKSLNLNQEQQDFEEGQIVEGIVKNITGYGVFIDLGHVDGLLHLTDISWSRINHPSEVLQLGQTVKLKIIKINPENKRISLGIKQLTEDPWGDVVNSYKINEVYKVKVTNITDYGVFVELAKGVEGLVHISEVAWNKSNLDLKSLYSVGEEVEVKVIDVDISKRRMNLSIKQCFENPWTSFKVANVEGSDIEVEVKAITENGLVVKLTDEIEGFVRATDISWQEKGEEATEALKDYQKGDKITVRILKNDPNKEKVVLSIKHLAEDPFASALRKLKKGDIVEVKVINNSNQNLEVELDSGITGIIKESDLSIEREEQVASNFEVGSKVEAMIIYISNTQRVLSLSIKAVEIAEQKKSMSTGDDSVATLGDALASAIGKKDKE